MAKDPGSEKGHLLQYDPAHALKWAEKNLIMIPPVGSAHLGMGPSVRFPFQDTIFPPPTFIRKQ